MTTIKPVEEVASNLDYIISYPEQGSGSTKDDVIKYLTSDRATIARVLCEGLEGMKEDGETPLGSQDLHETEVAYNQALDDAIVYIRTTLDVTSEEK